MCFISYCFSQEVLTQVEWKMLYPVKKKHVTSTQYNSHTFIILLETICHLSPPYPNGWAVQPLPTDRSLSADIVRLRLLFQEIAGLGRYSRVSLIGQA